MVLLRLKVVTVGVTPERPLQLMRARRRSSLFESMGVVFIHVPRTAGTSIATDIYGRFIGHFGLSDLMIAAPPTVRALPRFAIVRNPWDRAVSAWSYARNNMSKSDMVFRAAEYAQPAFGTFERFVNEWLAVQNVERIDGIFRPQHCYVLDKTGHMAFDHIGRLDDMAATEAWLSQVLGREMRFSHRNASPRASYQTYYTPALRDKVAEIYARDVALLGYDF